MCQYEAKHVSENEVVRLACQQARSNESDLHMAVVCVSVCILLRHSRDRNCVCVIFHRQSPNAVSTIKPRTNPACACFMVNIVSRQGASTFTLPLRWISHYHVCAPVSLSASPIRTAASDCYYNTILQHPDSLHPLDLREIKDCRIYSTLRPPSTCVKSQCCE